MKRGSIWWAYIGEPQGSSPGYRRPVVIVQADKFTRSQLRTVLVATISSNLRLADIPSNILVPATISTLRAIPSSISHRLLRLISSFLRKKLLIYQQDSSIF